MKRISLLFAGIFVLLLIHSCTSTEKSQRNIKYSFQVGINKGGITENTDLSIVPNADPTLESTVDAYSGATNTGVNTGFRINKPLLLGELESGLDYMYNHQVFSYADRGNFFLGVRKFHVNQCMIPLTYNFILFKKWLPATEMQIKIGYIAQVNFINSSGVGVLPSYTLDNWSNGITLGFSTYLINFKNGSKLGLYVDGYRGTRIYTDYYNQRSFEMPGSSFMKAGLKYRFK